MSDTVMLRESYDITAGDFTTAGEASGKIKRILKKLGVDSAIVRRVSVAAYEVELNLVIHSLGGAMELVVRPDFLELNVRDRGPGIPDIDLAMREGYSTASDDVRMMGFGAG
ncbi:MAG: anti-sigma regulatory factor, partial [Clostridia bacterium]